MSSAFDSKKHPHRRYNPLLDEWILVSPQRSDRPWQGQTEKSSQQELPAYDSGCYLCPGNVRANGEKKPWLSGSLCFRQRFRILTQRQS